MSTQPRAFAPDPSDAPRQPSILSKYAADFVSSYTAGSLCTPFIATLDRAVTENASGRNTLFNSATSTFADIVRHPVKFLRGPMFRWVLSVYGTTYFVNNLFDSYKEHYKTDVAFEKWIGSSAVNSTASMFKDKAFASLYGVATNTAPVPVASYVAWGARDLISMAFFVSLPPLVGKEIAKYTGNERSGYYVAQFMMPLVLQFLTSPIHLIGFDLYNNPNNTPAQRVAFLKKDYMKNVTTRMLRMMVPWSIGSIGNKELRTVLHSSLTPAPVKAL